MHQINLRCLSKPRPIVTRTARGHSHSFMPPAYVTWRTALQHALLAYTRTTGNCDMPYTKPVALTLHLCLRPRGGHPSDIDNLAGGFLDAANTILYTDDHLVHELHVTLDRHAATDAIHFDIAPLT